ncbi:hypothetical protein ACFQBQ_03500 [Granulicella cerasi]|uniref:Uncharacterized protein n=2 Tax=Granulicella cerasi TaxID=741063 RepID=A0ABW1Z6T5_9BACT|nr:hypothetical protein [Granulicella cerasi]
MMKGVMAALGHELELPPAIRMHCRAAEIALELEGRRLIVTRDLAEEYRLTVDEEGSSTTYSNAKDYANWFMGLLTESAPSLTNKQKQEAILYPSIVFPAFWVDQDHGWTQDYWTPPNKNFLLDQRQEVIRFLIGLPPRHPFRARTAFEEAKAALEKTEKSIELQRFVINRLERDERFVQGETPRLEQRKAQIEQNLEDSRVVLELIRSTTNVFDRELSALEAQLATLDARDGALGKRREQLSLVFSELEGEEEILTANVQATDLLRQFCGREDCLMFQHSDRSFGRSLLFLKDQIKDMRRTDGQLSREMATVAEEKRLVQAKISAKRAERAAAVEGSPQASISRQLSSLTNELVEVELKLAKLRQLATEQERFNRLLDRREQEVIAVTAARPHGIRGVGALSDARRLLSDSVQQWLTTLGTKNFNGAHFDDDLNLFVDGERFSITTHQSGSTRTRIVLAFHAAILEVALARGGNHPGWLLFDAPKQHELDQADFDAYTQRLQMVASRYPGKLQIVFSAADLKTQFEAGDEVWAPAFAVGGGLRFLGPTA